ncbi:MAG: hypothetical protein IPP94_16815 [Ignavibacteria bacterium]|nr:hypothetical protein [Ignavibacteria bacterium]
MSTSLRRLAVSSFRHVLLVLLACTAGAAAQEGIDIISQRGSLAIMPLYQTWKLGSSESFSEFGTDVSLYVPVLREAAVTLRNAPVMTSGAGVEKISGFTDTQIGALYHLEDQHLLFSIGVNLPTGKRELTREEFLSNVLLSTPALNMQVTQFGQGLNINPGVLWSISGGESAAFGLGVTYHYKGAFTPLKNSGDYDPGDEILATAGMDISVAEATNLSVDVIFTHYGKDVFEGEDVYAPGNKVVGGVQFMKYFGNDRLIVAGRYRSYGKGETPFAGVLKPTLAKSEPDNFELLGAYALRVSDAFTVTFTAEGRYFQETTAPVSGLRIGGLGVMPEFWLSRSIKLPLRFKVQAGTMKGGESVLGLEAGMGLQFGF